MRKTYKCSNVKFCMEDENQRRTWECLQTVTRKDGSYGKVLSDAFVAVLDGKPQAEADGNADDSVSPKVLRADDMEEMLDGLLDKRFHEMIRGLQEVLAEQIARGFREYAPVPSPSGSIIGEDTRMDGEPGQKREEELSEDMMAFALAMGE